MSITIKSGNNGNVAGVDSNGRLLVSSNADPVQHVFSHRDQQSYQVSSSIAIAASEQNFLILTNDNPSLDMVITYIRVMSIDAAAANANAYFSIKLEGSYTSGGSELTPTNMYVGSATSADGSFYGNGALTIGGSPVEIDRNYEANSMQSYNKQGSIVIPKGKSIVISHTGSTAAGTAYARVSFFMAPPKSN